MVKKSEPSAPPLYPNLGQHLEDLKVKMKVKLSD